MTRGPKEVPLSSQLWFSNVLDGMFSPHEVSKGESLGLPWQTSSGFLCGSPNSVDLHKPSAGSPLCTGLVTSGVKIRKVDRRKTGTVGRQVPGGQECSLVPVLGRGIWVPVLPHVPDRI